jgi:hypothetical protein
MVTTPSARVPNQYTVMVQLAPGTRDLQLLVWLKPEPVIVMELIATAAG